MSSNNATKGARGQAHAPARKSKGQKVSRERGTGTNHKKNPGKRAHQGGS